VLLKALVEGLSGKKIKPAGAIERACRPVSDEKPTARPFTQSEIDELCAMFGTPPELMRAPNGR